MCALWIKSAKIVLDLSQQIVTGSSRIELNEICVFPMVTKYGFYKEVYRFYKSVSFC